MRWLPGAVIHAATWFAFDFAIRIAIDSPARDAYGSIVAWWASLYVGFVAGVGLNACPAAFATMAVAMMLDTAAGAGVLFHDPPSLAQHPEFALSIGFSAVVFCLPIVVNSLVRRIIGMLRPSQSKSLQSRSSGPEPFA